MIRLGLDCVSYLCEKLNNPQDKLQFIHVAGTNGKGSTCAFIASILKESGLRVGVFSSPAVFSDEEVIRIGNRHISRKDYTEGLNKIDSICCEIEKEGRSVPTEFERLSALAFMYFADKECDIVVLECGMGGLTDATNIIKNTLISVITSISMDHMEYLGDSLHKIAETKAGIIKPGIPVITSNTDKEIVDAISTVAAKSSSEVYITEPNDKLKRFIPLEGSYQIENASLATEAVMCISGSVLFNGKVVNITNKSIEKGLHNTKWPGRFEIIHRNPIIVIDGAHNPGAALRLKESLNKKYGNKNLIFVTGMLKDKDIDTVSGILAPLAKHILTISTFGSRGLDAVNLANMYMKYNSNVSSIGGIEEAMDIAYMMADKNDVIVVFGSLSFLNKVSDWSKDKFR